MKKKLGVFLILGAMCASLLAGCSFGSEPAANDTSSDTDSAVVSTVESSTPEGSSSADEDPDVEQKTISWETSYENKTGDSSAALVKITGDSNPAINAINAEIDNIRADYEEALQELDDYAWLEYVAIPSGNARFMNIAVHSIQYPTYGYQGDIETFIYDIENEKQISKDDVLQMNNLTDDSLQQLFAGYYNSLGENNKYRVIDDFEVEGAVLYEDGSAAIFLQVETEDGPEMPLEYITSNNNELYIYHTAEDTFSIFNFTNF